MPWQSPTSTTPDSSRWRSNANVKYPSTVIVSVQPGRGKFPLLAFRYALLVNCDRPSRGWFPKITRGRPASLWSLGNMSLLPAVFLGGCVTKTVIVPLVQPYGHCSFALDKGILVGLLIDLLKTVIPTLRLQRPLTHLLEFLLLSCSPTACACAHVTRTDVLKAHCGGKGWSDV